MPQAEDAYDTSKDEFRSHLGASLLGRECAREIWYSWRWTKVVTFEGRMLRLFNRGHLEEPRMMALLKIIGCDIWQYDDAGKQFRMHGYKGHYGGGLDGVCLGIPDIPAGMPVLTEFKTHNAKSFAKLVSEGVAKSKPEHYVQMNQYAGYYKLNASVYMATNKDTDDIYAEIIPFDQANYHMYSDRAKRIIESPSPPPKISRTPGWFKCRMCSYNKECHDKLSPLPTCRSCKWVSVEENGVWACNYYGGKYPLTKEQQRAGCPNYSIMPTFFDEV